MAGHVPLVGVAGDDPQHLGFRAADDDRRMRTLDRFGFAEGVLQRVEPTIETHRLLGPQPADHRQCLVKHRDTCSGAGEFDAVPAVLGLVPSGADPEIEASAGDVVDGDRHLRQDRRVAVGDAGDHAAHPRVADHHGHRRQSGPALVGELGVVDQAVEVVVVPYCFEAEVVGSPPELFEFGVFEGGRELDRDPHDAEPRSASCVAGHRWGKSHSG